MFKKIRSLGYNFDSSDNDGISEFILKCFADKNIDVKEKTIKRWINKTDDTPENTYNDREIVYKICFALSMNEKETEEFFVKGYLERSFNFKSVSEAVYYSHMSVTQKTIGIIALQCVNLFGIHNSFWVAKEWVEEVSSYYISPEPYLFVYEALVTVTLIIFYLYNEYLGNLSFTCLRFLKRSNKNKKR